MRAAVEKAFAAAQNGPCWTLGSLIHNREVLERLESDKAAHGKLDDLPLFAMAEPPAPPPSSAVDDALSGIEPDELTPREALETLYRLKGLSAR